MDITKKSEFTAAFVLHQRPYRETSLLVEVFTKQKGRINLLAKGVRAKRKRRQAFPSLFQLFQLSWYGHGELVNLSRFEVDGPAFRLTGNAGLCGFYLNELLVRLLPLYEPEPTVFTAYQQALQQLRSGGQDEVTLRLFEKQLLLHLGYGLQLQYDVEAGAALEEDQHYFYHVDNGPCRHPVATRQTISGRSLRHLKEEQGFDEHSLIEIKRLMRKVLDYYLGGRPLQSRRLFTQLQQFNSGDS